MVMFHAPFYNVHANVGPSTALMQADVQLVQYFLFFICIGSSPTWPGGFSQFGVTAPAGVDGANALFPFTGKFTPDLGKWIRHFQVVANARGFGPLTVDGAVNHAKTSWGHPPVPNAGWFTIQAMNHLMFLKNQKAFVNLVDVDDLPPAVKKDIKALTTN
jgi:hypothetical protein